jgi:methylthioribose-1-phosphate isomerase
MTATTALMLLVLHASQVTPASFTTKAQVTVDRTVLSLTSAVATIEPRPNAPGYRWLRVHFYAFALSHAEAAAAGKGNIDPLERRWEAMAGNRPAAYNVSNAILQLAVDKDGKVWQVDLSVPGHTCTIASSDVEANKLLQDYQFDGTRLRLRTRGAHPCEKFAWDVDLKTTVVAAGIPRR